MIERLGQVLLTERQLANGPDLGILIRSVVSRPKGSEKVKPTGLSVFLISLFNVPALMAMISGAASGSWAMGEPHSEQKIRWTGWPEEPLLVYFLAGPLIVNWALGTTATRAFIYQQEPSQVFLMQKTYSR